MLGSNQEIKLQDSHWVKLNSAWAIFFIVCAALNIYIAFWLSLDTWMNFKVFGLTAGTLILLSSVLFIFTKTCRKNPSNKKSNRLVTRLRIKRKPAFAGFFIFNGLFREPDLFSYLYCIGIRHTLTKLRQEANQLT